MLRGVLRAAAPAAFLATSWFSRSALAEDGGNDVCPAAYAEADEVRERYDASGRLVHQLRLKQGYKVGEIAIVHRDGHAVFRTEATPGQTRVARTAWDGDRVASASCEVNGRNTARATYRYDGERLVAVEKRFVEPPAAGATQAAKRLEVTRFFHDLDGQLVATEVRDGKGKLLSVTRADRPARAVPITLAVSAGGSYQSDTELYDFTAGLGLYRRPQVLRYGADPLEVELDATFRLHRTAGVTTTDQTTLRFGADYHELLPRLTLFTFTAFERNVPANLRLNLEVAVLGVKLAILRGDYQLDASFAPIWNFRSIDSPEAGADAMPESELDETSSKLRGSFRVRAGIHRPTWSLLNTFELLPTFFGEDLAPEDTFWDRTVLRDTLRFEIRLSPRFSFRQELKYTRDPAIRAQATCPDSENPLCRGESYSSSTSLVLNLDL